MSGNQGGAPLAVLSSDPEARRSIEQALARDWRVLSAPLGRLATAPALLDAIGAVVHVSAECAASDLQEAEALRALPCARTVVLLAEMDEPPLLDLWFKAIDPRSVVPYPLSPDMLRAVVARALPGEQIGSGARPLHRPAPVLLGVSGAIRSVMEQIDRVAPTRASVLILGETGTGKELVARALHEKSPRSSGHFVALNCGALPESIMESELFGHERGSFTGADQERQGLLEQASGGTLFLDEVGEMPHSLQVKLLRALENGEIRRVGGRRAFSVDLRLVCATHRPLEEQVEEGRFRQDLFYRLNTVIVHIPPLRRRQVDIPFLAQHFAELYGGECARRITLEDSFVEALTRHDFPGNVRELRNAVERAIALASPGEPVSDAHLPESVRRATPTSLGLEGPLQARIERIEREAIAEAAELERGNRTRMAERLGLSRHGLRQKMRRLGML